VELDLHIFTVVTKIGKSVLRLYFRSISDSETPLQFP